jgi:hypothetical protein
MLNKTQRICANMLLAEGNMISYNLKEKPLRIKVIDSKQALKLEKQYRKALREYRPDPFIEQIRLINSIMQGDPFQYSNILTL